VQWWCWARWGEGSAHPNSRGDDGEGRGDDGFDGGGGGAPAVLTVGGGDRGALQHHMEEGEVRRTEEQ
jgi:hypothetical protein